MILFLLSFKNKYNKIIISMKSEVRAALYKFDIEFIESYSSIKLASAKL